jgi:polysaccharide export outer membrane protein
MATTDGGALMQVRAGDVVFVPKTPTFSVVGAVTRAGTFALTPGMTVDQAIAAAGDISAFGTRSRLRIRRGAATGAPAKLIEVGPDDAVQPGDIIVVRERLL